MRKELTSLDIYYLTKELQLLKEAKIEKIYQQKAKEDLLFKLYLPGKGKAQLKISLPSFIYLTEFKEKFPETPPGFCGFLRKYLQGGRLKQITQHEFERIIEITIDSRKQEWKFLIELFSKGNILLLTNENKIKGLLKTQNWSSRTLRGGINYDYPPSRINPLTASEEELSELLQKSKRTLVKGLAVELGLGGVYAEELCSHLTINKETPLNTLTAIQLKKIVKELNKLFTKKGKAVIYKDEYYPFSLTDKKGTSQQTFSEAISTILSKQLEEDHLQKEKESSSTETSKAEAIINAQQKQFETMKKAIDLNQKKGELIYEHFSTVNEILTQINTARKKLSWEEIKEKLKGHKIIKKINEKEGTIEVDLS